MENSKASFELSAQEPIIVFLAAAFVGFTIGPRLVSLAKGIITIRATELASEFLERCLTDLKKEFDSSKMKIAS